MIELNNFSTNSVEIVPALPFASTVDFKLLSILVVSATNPVAPPLNDFATRLLRGTTKVPVLVPYTEEPGLDLNNKPEDPPDAAAISVYLLASIYGPP